MGCASILPDPLPAVRTGYRLLWTDGDKIFQRFAETPQEFASAATEELHDPAGIVTGLSGAIHDQGLWVAWLDSNGVLRVADFSPRAPGEALPVFELSRHSRSRPGLAARDGELWVTTTDLTSISMHRTDDGGATWSERRVHAFTKLGCTDVAVQGDSRQGDSLWVLSSTSGREPEDVLALYRFRPRGAAPLLQATYPVNGLPPGILGSRTVRLAARDDALAVSSVTHEPAFAILGVDEVRSTVVARAELDPGDRLRWERGAVNDGSLGERPCSATPYFIGDELYWVWADHSGIRGRQPGAFGIAQYVDSPHVTDCDLVVGTTRHVAVVAGTP